MLEIIEGAGFYFVGNRQSHLWREEQAKLSAQIAAHQNANVSYIDSGVKILELTQRALIL